MKSLRAVAALVLLAAAVLVALLASDVRAWQRTLTRDDVLLSSSAPSTSLPSSFSKGLIGIGDDLALRRALELFRKNAFVSTTLSNAVDVSIKRSQMESALAAVAVNEKDPKRLSQLYTLLGILAYGDFARGDHNPTQTAAVIDAFQTAVQADPDNENAKYDLELVERTFSRRGVGSGFSSNRGSPGYQGHRGAGASAPGSGY